MRRLISRAFLLLTILFAQASLLGRERVCSLELQQRYEQECIHPSEINEHVSVLCELASECSSVVEIGLREMHSTWGILRGLVDSPADKPSYLGIDLNKPDHAVFSKASTWARANGITFDFWAANDMKVNLPGEVDMLFIDSLHTYCHLTYELEKFSPLVRKYISMHDTSAPWGEMDDDAYHGNYHEYPAHIDRTRRGLWPAVQDFLAKHPEWALKERRTNNHGFVVLERLAR